MACVRPRDDGNARSSHGVRRSSPLEIKSVSTSHPPRPSALGLDPQALYSTGIESNPEPSLLGPGQEPGPEHEVLHGAPERLEHGDLVRPLPARELTG